MKQNVRNTQVAEFFGRASEGLRVCMPAEVTFCDPDRHIVNVIPMYNERVMSEEGREIEYAEMQEILDVPLPDICGIRFNIPVGDHGLLIFNDVDLDGYKLSRERLDLASSRTHDYNDAVFIPAEVAQPGRPDPYMTFENNMITVHKKIIFEQDVKAEIDVIAGAQNASLVNTNMAYNMHTHTGNLGFSTGPAQAPAQPGVFVPEVPKVG